MFTSNRIDSKKSFTRDSSLAFAAAVAALLQAACSNEDTTALARAELPAAPQQEPEGEQPAAESPAFVVLASIDNPEGRTNYAGLVDPAGEDAEFDTDAAIEVPADGRLYAPPSGGYFGIGDSEGLVVIRYEVDAERNLRENGRLSFAGVGVRSFSNTMVFVSATKAYFLDEANLQVVVWNPAELTIDGTIDVSELEREGYQRVLFPLFHSVVRGDRVLASVAWQNEEGEFRKATGLLVLDTARDAVARVEETDRCAGAQDIIVGSNGDAYFASSVDPVVWDASVRGVERSGCILRVKAGAESFDPDYRLLLSDATGGGVAYGLTGTNDPDRPYIWALDETVTPWSASEPIDSFGAAAWGLWRLDLETGTAVPDDSVPLSGPTRGSLWFEADERRFLMRPAADYRSSQLFEATTDGLELRLSSPGFIQGFARVR